MKGETLKAGGTVGLPAETLPADPRFFSVSSVFPRLGRCGLSCSWTQDPCRRSSSHPDTICDPLAEAFVRTLRQFVSESEKAPPRLLEGYIVRGGFSHWIRDVFGDHALANELRALEERYQPGSRGQTLSEMAGAIRGRYDLTDDELETVDD